MSFGRLDPIVKNKLFQAYGSSHYGSELWDLSCSTLSEYCAAWQRGLRRIWELPNTLRSDYLSTISCTGPIYDVLCRRFLNFIATCYSSDSELIRFVIKHAVSCAQARSPIGRNYALSYKRYGFKVEDELKSGLKSSCLTYEALMHMSATDYCHVSFAL